MMSYGLGPAAPSFDVHALRKHIVAVHGRSAWDGKVSSPLAVSRNHQGHAAGERRLGLTSRASHTLVKMQTDDKSDF